MRFGRHDLLGMLLFFDHHLLNHSIRVIDLVSNLVFYRASYQLFSLILFAHPTHHRQYKDCLFYLHFQGIDVPFL